MKYYLKLFLRNVLKLFFIFPINKNTFFFDSFDGKSQSCSPLYIFLELKKRYPEKTFIWSYKDTKPTTPEFDNVKFVKVNSIKSLIAQITSKYIIINGGLKFYIPFRKTQIIINTWHGGGAYKRINTNKTKDIIKAEEYECKHLTYFLSSSRIFTKIMAETNNYPLEKYLEIGLPRNDIFFDKISYNTAKKQVCDFYKIDPNLIIVLYAPTYRGNFKNSFINISFDSDKIKKTIKQKYNKNALILYRGHYSTISNNNTKFDLNVSNYPDMQKLLCTADILITDYSSSMWDFSLTQKPCFLYVPDLMEYTKDPGFYTDPSSWGFPICQNEEELTNAIINFDKESYIKAININHMDFGSFEKGNASSSVCNVIEGFFLCQQSQ